jgi:hypothetical protein
MKDAAKVDVPSKDPPSKSKSPEELAALKAGGMASDTPAEEELVRAAGRQRSLRANMDILQWI